MIKVFLREKKLKHGRKGLYLDFYPPIIHPDTGRQTRREHLRLYVHEKPKLETARDHNKETKILAETIRSRRQIELQAGAYGFVSGRHRQKSFLDYFSKIVETKKKESKGTLTIWRAAEKHLKAFSKDQCRFADLTEKFCEDFRSFLSRIKTCRKARHQPISTDSGTRSGKTLKAICSRTIRRKISSRSNSSTRSASF